MAAGDRVSWVGFLLYARRKNGSQRVKSEVRLDSQIDTYVCMYMMHT